MDCEQFFEMVEVRLDGLSDPSRTSTSRQCVIDFFHPRTAASLADSVPVSAFYRSGIVWFVPTRSLKVELRVPETYDDRVLDELSALDRYQVSRTAHRPAAMSSGEYLRLVHYGVTCDDASEADVKTILDAVSAVLSV